MIKGVLCFEAQLIYALAKPHLQGGLKGEYTGEGDTLMLTIKGKLKGDPEIYDHESPMLKDVHPGYTTKMVDGKSIRVCRGSPLWDRKPRMQLWYDTTRDWIRKHCPEAIFGVYAKEEMEESDIEANVLTMPTLAERVNKNPRPETGEGFRPEFVRSEIARAQTPDPAANAIEPIDAVIEPPPDFGPDIPAVEESKPKRKGGRPLGSKNGSKNGNKSAPKEPEVADISEPLPQQEEPLPPQPSPSPQTPPWQSSFLLDDSVPELSQEALDYIERTKVWIANATDPNEAGARWESEVDVRHRLLVPVSERRLLQDILEDRVAELHAENRGKH
jgi:hypothetical protein